MNQEERERFYLDKFSGSLGLGCQDIRRGSDPPDFVIQANGLRIALEITEFYSDAKGAAGHPRRLVEEEWRKLQAIIAQIRDRHSELHEVNCTVYFKALSLPSRREYNKFAEELANFIIGNLSNLLSETGYFKISSDGFPLLERYVGKICLNKVGCYITWDWNHSGGFIGLSEDGLERVISEKVRQDISEDSCDENWLLIVADGGEGISQGIGLPHVDELNGFMTIKRKLEMSSFDKVYIFQYIHDRIFEWRRGRGWFLVKDRGR